MAEKKINTTRKGNRNRLKTQHLLEKMGYETQNAEKFIRYLDRATGKMKMFKKDLFGADVIAMNRDKIIFVQVKSDSGDRSAGIKEFQKYPFPEFVDRWVVIWTGNEHEIVEI